MTATESKHTTPDGIALIERRWPAPTPSTGSLLLVHGLGEHARRYEHVAAALTAIGIEVWSWDQRGFGRSAGPRATLPTRTALLDDAARMFERLTAHRRSLGDREPPFVLGHSMGGGIVARAVTGGWLSPRGMILSSPALAPRMSALDRAAAAIGARVAPHLRVPSRLKLGTLSHDPAIEAAVRADTDCHDRVTPRLVMAMRSAGARAIADAPRCRVPTLVMVAGDDHLVDPGAAVRFHDAMPHSVSTLRVYDGLYHEIFNEREPDRTRVLDDLTGWIRNRLAPSGFHRAVKH